MLRLEPPTDPTLLLLLLAVGPSLAYVSCRGLVVAFIGCRGPALALSAFRVVVTCEYCSRCLVLRWRGCVWQETPTSHDDSLVVVVGVVGGGVCISSL